MEVNEEKIRKRLRHHFARTPKDVRFDFQVLVRDLDGEILKYGIRCEHGNMRGYKKVLDFIDEGYEFIAVRSTFAWDWMARRYISHYEADRVNVCREDADGRYYVEEFWHGFYTKIEVLENGRFKTYGMKCAFNSSTMEDKLYHKSKGFDEKKELFEKTDWAEWEDGFKHVSNLS